MPLMFAGKAMIGCDSVASNMTFKKECARCGEDLNAGVLCGGHRMKKQVVLHEDDSRKQKCTIQKKSARFSLRMLETLTSKRTWILSPRVRFTYK